MSEFVIEGLQPLIQNPPEVQRATFKELKKKDQKTLFHVHLDATCTKGNSMIMKNNALEMFDKNQELVLTSPLAKNIPFKHLYVSLY